MDAEPTTEDVRFFASQIKVACEYAGVRPYFWEDVNVKTTDRNALVDFVRSMCLRYIQDRHFVLVMLDSVLAACIDNGMQRESLTAGSPTGYSCLTKRCRGAASVAVAMRDALCLELFDIKRAGDIARKLMWHEAFGECIERGAPAHDPEFRNLVDHPDACYAWRASGARTIEEARRAGRRANPNAGRYAHDEVAIRWRARILNDSNLPRRPPRRHARPHTPGDELH